MYTSSDDIGAWALSCLLLSLRITPVFAFAPPFTLTRFPALFRVLLGIGLSVSLLSVHPDLLMRDDRLGQLVVVAVAELALGAMIVLIFQLAFAAIQVVGRTIDIQAGFGLALLIDPTSRAQTPLVGTLFSYLAAAAFFSADGHLDLFGFLSATLEVFPLGAWAIPNAITRVTGFISMMFLTAFGAGGITIVALFLVDFVVALLSRTVAQMNVLVFGLQVKTIVVLTVLPLSFGAGGAVLAHMMFLTLKTLPRVL